VHEIFPHDRPREKLTTSGAATLGDNELVAIVIGHGTNGTGALDVANALLARADGVRGLTRLHRLELESVPGIGPALAARLLAAVELGRRTLLGAARARPQLLDAAASAEFLLPRFGAHPVERFGVVMLDMRLRVLGVRLLSVGSLNAAAADARDVFREAVLANAGHIVVFHNHPSGDPRPSAEDVELTERLARAGDLLGIPLLDHLVLADASYCSLRASRAGGGAWRGREREPGEPR
jgi:DNA repair protein RadC